MDVVSTTTLPLSEIPQSCYDVDMETDVFFDRNATSLPASALDRAAIAKLRLENYYKDAIGRAIERRQRYGKPYRMHVCMMMECSCFTI
jgi:hypothetical protein